MKDRGSFNPSVLFDFMDAYLVWMFSLSEIGEQYF